MEESADNTADRLHIPEKRQASFLEKLSELSPATLAWWLMVTASTIAIGLALFHLFVAAFGTPESRAFRSTHLTGMLVLAVLITPLWRNSPQDLVLGSGDGFGRWRLFGFVLDCLFVLLVLGIQVYTLYDLEAFQRREGNLSSIDVIAGSTLLLLVLEATRRIVGWPMVIITVFFVIHAPVSYTHLRAHET